MLINEEILPSRIDAAIAAAARRLQQADVADAPTEARLLCAGVLDIDRAQLLADSARPLEADEAAALNAAVARRSQGEPLARILGRAEFWSLTLALNAATLIPRADSETLIDAALALLLDRRAPLRILDLGTGSGCLLLALLSEYPFATGLGVDCAPDAARMAAYNATQLGFAGRAAFSAADWNDAEFTAKIGGTAAVFDLVIANPPYIARGVIATLDREVRDYDPLPALDGGEDGLAAYRRLAALLPSLWRAGGLALFEIGFDQADGVTAIFRAAGLGEAKLRRDLAGQARCLVLRRDQVT